MLNILNSFALYYTSIIFLHNSTPSLNLYIPLRGKSYWINITIIIISQNGHYIAQYLPVYEDNVDYTQNHRNNSNHGALDENVRKTGLSCGPWVFLANPKHCKVTAGSLRQGPKNREQTLDWNPGRLRSMHVKSVVKFSSRVKGPTSNPPPY